MKLVYPLGFTIKIYIMKVNIIDCVYHELKGTVAEVTYSTENEVGYIIYLLDVQHPEDASVKLCVNKSETKRVK